MTGTASSVKPSAVHQAELNWHALTVADVTSRLGTDAIHGLAAAESARRLGHYGLNVLETGERTPWYMVVARQFVDTLIAILVVAALVSFAVGEVGD